MSAYKNRDDPSLESADLLGLVQEELKLGQRGQSPKGTILRGLLVYQMRKISKSGLGDALDVIPRQLRVMLGASLSESLASFASSIHVNTSI